MNEHRPPAAAILAVPVIVAIVLALFAWPSSRLEPRDLPVGVAVWSLAGLAALALTNLSFRRPTVAA